jgi:hypothetical protein
MSEKIEFEVTATQSFNIGVLTQKLGFKTKEDLINAALTLMEAIEKEKEKGKKFAFLDEKNKTYELLAMDYMKN